MGPAMEPANMEPLKFVALDPDDLEVVSTHLQDAEVKVADVHWRPQEKRLVLALDRFDWQAWTASNPDMRRRRAALRFDRVLSCKCKKVAPAGTVTLVFSGGPALRLEVECLEVELVDLGPTPVADVRPAKPAEAPGARH